MLRVAIVIAVVAIRYWWLQRRGAKASTEAWQRAHARTGAAIYRLATGLGGAFVKVGQVLGARADVLPPAFVAPLRGLHDQVPPRPFAKLRRHVEHELASGVDGRRGASSKAGGAEAGGGAGAGGGVEERRGRSIDDVFESIDETPIAAASLAQVHRATLADGARVVVKIQYPEARRLFPIDLASLRMAVRVARRLNRGLDLRPLAAELAEQVGLELDFTREAASTERVRANVAGDGDVVVPRVYRELSSGKLLVLEFLEGTPLSAVEKLREQGVDLGGVARRVAALYARMIFQHGFFHGDPHPGNILVLRDGRLGLLDFGLAKELPEGFAANAAEMFAGVAANDAPRAIAAARAIGFTVADDRAPELFGLVRSLLGDYRETGKLLESLQSGGLAVPSQFTLIARVMVILSGVSHMLVPGERIIGHAMAAALLPHVKPRAAAGVSSVP